MMAMTRGAVAMTMLVAAGGSLTSFKNHTEKNLIVIPDAKPETISAPNIIQGTQVAPGEMTGEGLGNCGGGLQVVLSFGCCIGCVGCCIGCVGCIACCVGCCVGCVGCSNGCVRASLSLPNVCASLKNNKQQ